MTGHRLRVPHLECARPEGRRRGGRPAAKSAKVRGSHLRVDIPGARSRYAAAPA